MKNILLILITLISAKVYAEDFVISISSGASAKWKLKLDSQVVFEESKTKSLQNMYKHTSNGNYTNFDPTTNKISVAKSRLLFESLDCSGTPHFSGPPYPTLVSNLGLYASILNSFQATKVLNSKREWGSPTCSQASSTYGNVWEMRPCTECNFGDDSVFNAVEE